MAAKKKKQSSKKIKNLSTRSVSDKNAKGVKGGGVPIFRKVGEKPL
jgi:hypothetical protein